MLHLPSITRSNIWFNIQILSYSISKCQLFGMTMQKHFGLQFSEYHSNANKTLFERLLFRVIVTRITPSNE